SGVLTQPSRVRNTKSCIVAGFCDGFCDPATTSTAATTTLFHASMFGASLFEQGFETVYVVADDCLAVHDGNGRGHHAEFFKLSKGTLIRRDVTVGESDVLLAKEFLHASTEHSAGLGIEHDRSRHAALPLFCGQARPASGTAVPSLFATPEHTP